MIEQGPWPDERVVRSAGHPQAKRMFFSVVGRHKCGEIEDGISLRHAGEAGWVLDWDDFEAVYLAAKNMREVKP